jgi:hypothetical protein
MNRHTLICTDRNAVSSDETSHFKADCASCKGLCCILLPFDADQGFGFDKPAAIPCPHLNGGFSCSIHTSLEQRGFPGCVQFDCHGAGQYVTAQLGLDERWYTCEETIKQAYDLFTAAVQQHTQLAIGIKGP